MATRNLFLGNPQGKTAWQHLKSRWAGARQQQVWSTAFARITNPLNLKPGDLVEIGFMDKVGWNVETVLFFRTPDGDPDYIRYALQRIGQTELAMLEVMPGGDEGEPNTLSLFSLIDEFELDEQLLEVLDAEDVLRRTDVDAQGRQVEIDYQKDFVTEATVEIFSKDEVRKVRVFTYNYFTPAPADASPDEPQGEGYLCVEVVEDARWMNFYKGRRLDTSDVLALGTAVEP